MRLVTVSAAGGETCGARVAASLVGCFGRGLVPLSAAPLPEAPAQPCSSLVFRCYPRLRVRDSASFRFSTLRSRARGEIRQCGGIQHAGRPLSRAPGAVVADGATRSAGLGDPSPLGVESLSLGEASLKTAKRTHSSKLESSRAEPRPPLSSSPLPYQRHLPSYGPSSPPLPPLPAPPLPTHPVLCALRERVASRSSPGSREDGLKIGLAVEGGGMRGCVTGGSLQALQEVGLLHAFDGVYGASAGAMNAAYFVSHNHGGVAIYHDLIAHRGFLCLSRLWAAEDAKLARRHVEARLVELEEQCRQGGEGVGDGLHAALDPPSPPALNLEFLVDEIMGSVLPLDWRAVAASPVPLKVVASSLDALRPVLLEGFTSWADLALCLKASATVPRLAGGPRRHRGHRLVDAAVFDAVPFTSAIQDGCTHVLALSSRPEPPPPGSWSHRAGAALETVVKKLLFSPPYMAGAWRAEAAALGRAGMSQDHVLAGAREPLEPELEDYLALMEGEVTPGSWERRVPLVRVEEGVATLQRAPGEGGTRRRKQGKGKSAHEPAEAFVYPVYPGSAASFSPLCIDPDILRRGVAEGRASLLKAMHQTLAGVLDLEPWAREIADPTVGEEAHS